VFADWLEEHGGPGRAAFTGDLPRLRQLQLDGNMLGEKLRQRARERFGPSSSL
jgi:hypothetical protein